MRVSDRRQQVQAVALALLLVGGVAHADDDVDFRAAVTRAQTDPAGALADFEAIAQRPPSRWTDNAWSEAARLAERAGDFARAMRALEGVVRTSDDAAMVRRARATIERLAASGGAEWGPVAKQHDALVSEIMGGGDPYAALDALGALVRASPGYPRATAARMAIARGYEMQGDTDEALAWMRDAIANAPITARERVQLELVRMAIRMDELAVAREAIPHDGADRTAVAEAVADLNVAESRAWIRRGVWAVIALLGGLALWSLRRVAGSWRAAGRRMLGVPLEVIFVAPLAAIVCGLAAAGNPLVARSIMAIAIAGTGVAWFSGVLLDSVRTRRRLVVHIACVVLAIACIAYLAIEHRVLGLLLQTWRGGHALD